MHFFRRTTTPLFKRNQAHTGFQRGPLIQLSTHASIFPVETRQQLTEIQNGRPPPVGRELGNVECDETVAQALHVAPEQLDMVCNASLCCIHGRKEPLPRTQAHDGLAYFGDT